jgi:hypothetical protein
LVLVSPPTPPRVELKQLPIPRLFLQLLGRGFSSSFNSGGVAPVYVDVAPALLVVWLCTSDAWLLQTWILCPGDVAQRMTPNHRGVAPAPRRRGSCNEEAWLLQQVCEAPAPRRRGSCTKEAWLLHSRCVASVERRRGSCYKEAWLLH